MSNAACVSACWMCPHARQRKTAWLSRFPAASWPQTRQRRGVYRGSTSITRTPAIAALSFSRRTKMPQHWPRIARFRAAFARTLCPGSATVPRALRTMFPIWRPSTAMRSWSRTNPVVVFSTQSRRRSLSLARSRPRDRLVRCLRFEPLLCRERRLWRRRARSTSLAQRRGAGQNCPSLVAMEFTTPRSMPTRAPVGSRSTSQAPESWIVSAITCRSRSWIASRRTGRRYFVHQTTW
jgi:hypothetical protein